MKKYLIFGIVFLLCVSFASALSFNYTYGTPNSTGISIDPSYKIISLNNGTWSANGSVDATKDVVTNVGVVDNGDFFKINFSENYTFTGAGFQNLFDGTGAPNTFNLTVYVSRGGVETQVYNYYYDDKQAYDVNFSFTPTTGDTVKAVVNGFSGATKLIVLGEFWLNATNATASTTSLTLTNFYNGSSINTFSATINNGSYSYT